MTPTTVIILGGALFSAEGKLLLLKQRAQAGGEEPTWAFPGGALEFGESPEPGLVRTFCEATGLDINVDRALGSWSALQQAGGIQHHIIHIDWTVGLSAAMTGVDIDLDVYAQFAWLGREDALNRITVPSMRTSVERAFNMLARSRKNT